MSMGDLPESLSQAILVGIIFVLVGRLGAFSQFRQVARALSTLAMILQNLLNNPTSERHRKADRGKPRIQQHLSYGKWF